MAKATPAASSAETTPCPCWATVRTAKRPITASTVQLGIRRRRMSLTAAMTRTTEQALATASRSRSLSGRATGRLSLRGQGLGHRQVLRGAGIVGALGLDGAVEQILGRGVVAAHHGGEAGVVEQRRLIVLYAAGGGARVLALHGHRQAQIGACGREVGL